MAGSQVDVDPTKNHFSKFSGISTALELTQPPLIMVKVEISKAIKYLVWPTYGALKTYTMLTNYHQKVSLCITWHTKAQRALAVQRELLLFWTKILKVHQLFIHPLYVYSSLLSYISFDVY